MQTSKKGKTLSHHTTSIKRKQTEYQKQRASEANTKHGGSKLKEYRVWSEMIQRCTNPNSRYYFNYGGRGIKVCDQWLDFANFISDMGSRPEKTCLDRINNDGDYSPENCKWSTRTQQMNNTRKNVVIEFNGQSMTRTEWARKLGLNPHTLKRRFYDGWPKEKALTTPTLKGGRYSFRDKKYKRHEVA
jgi:hypothetical protein